MADQPDKANVIVRPPIALLLAFLAGLLADWLYPLKLLPALRNSQHDTFAPIDSYGFSVWADWSVPHVLLGSFIFVAGFALMVWAITTIRAAGTRPNDATDDRDRSRGTVSVQPQPDLSRNVPRPDRPR